VNSKFILIVIICILIVSACSEESALEVSKKNDIKATMIMTQFEYDDSTNSIMGRGVFNEQTV